MQRLFCLGAALFGTFLSGVALAQNLLVGDLTIIHPHIPAPAVQAHSAAGYMTISNAGDQADRLIGVEIGVAAVAGLHLSASDDAGVVRMQAQAGADIPAGETIWLEPGGLHVMLMGLTGPLREGDILPAVLIFERAGRVEITFLVEPRAPQAAHATHGTGGTGD